MPDTFRPHPTTSTPRRIALLAAVAALAVIAGCATAPPPPRTDVVVNQPAELAGEVVGPVVFGAPPPSYGLKLAVPVVLDDGAGCGRQMATVLPIDTGGMETFAGRQIALLAVPYCRAGQYRLRQAALR